MLMVQSNTQVPMKNAKLKGPPPVPPRPNQSVVAEALAKTRKAVADSRANLTKSRTNIKPDTKVAKAKTLERSHATAQSTTPSPKQNGLARVKSFIRDVISDRSSSSDERKSSGQNSRRSSSDSSSTPTTLNSKKSNESLNTKAVKTCRQIIVRSLSTSNKLDQEAKCKVNKSSSFAEKTFPLRKAPPPPLSPKPKLKPMKPLPVHKQSLESIFKRKHTPPELSPYSSPIDATKPQSITEAPYATVEEIQSIDDRLVSPVKQSHTSDTCNGDSVAEMTSFDESLANTNSLERKTSRVTEMLISEIIASRNKNDANVVIDKGKEELFGRSVGDGSPEILIDNNMNNHEMLIYELQSMRSQTNVPEKLEMQVLDESEMCSSEENCEDCPASPISSVNTQDSDYTDPYAYIIDNDLKSRLRKQYRAISNMSLHGLPPLPKSLSGFADAPESGHETSNSSPSSPDETKPPTDLESQLDYLKKEMAGLRQLDLSLLSELWALSESMASWRRQLDRGTRLRPAPPPPPPPHYLRT